MAENNSGLLFNKLFSILLKKIRVPTDFHGRVECVKEMLADDISGMVDSLTDFAVDTASVDFSIETDNPELTKILKKWLDNINSSYQGKIPRGIKSLAEEYFKERWKNSSFPILKIAKWETIDEIKVPTKMFFVDGGSVYAKEIDTKTDTKSLIGYNYYLGAKKEEELNKGVIITRPYGRWFDDYPNPYLIKRGVYHNWKIIESLKKRESEILEQVIPYLLTIKKGTENLALEDVKTYTNKELKDVVNDLQALITKMNTTDLSGKSIQSPVRATQFDEEIKHLIPDLRGIFDPKLFITAEKNILAGLGFVDVVEAVSTSRRESILNPKAFIEETKKGVEDFKKILRELVAQIIEQNKDTHTKYMSDKITFYINSSPVKGFMTQDFKELIRSMYDRGRISSQTAVELIGEVDFRTEVHRREQEGSDGIDETLYPPVIRNQEGKGIDLPSDLTGEPETPEEENKDNVPEDKKGIEKKNYDMAKKELTGAPYQTIKQLPSRVKNNLDTDLQNVFIRVFNNAYSLYKNETRAFRVAWSVIRQIGRKGKDGKWHRKKRRVKGKLEKIKINRAMLDKILEKEEKDAIEDVIKLRQIENLELKNKLTKKLLSNEKE